MFKHPEWAYCYKIISSALIAIESIARAYVRRCISSPEIYACILLTVFCYTLQGQKMTLKRLNLIR